MTTVYKYKLNPDALFTLLPEKAEVLNFHAQGDDLYIWAMVDTESRPLARRFKIYGTGHPMTNPTKSLYIGTAHMSNGLVFHCFEEI